MLFYIIYFMLIGVMLIGVIEATNNHLATRYKYCVNKTINLYPLENQYDVLVLYPAPLINSWHQIYISAIDACKNRVKCYIFNFQCCTLQLMHPGMAIICEPDDLE